MCSQPTLFCSDILKQTSLFPHTCRDDFYGEYDRQGECREGNPGLTFVQNVTSSSSLLHQSRWWNVSLPALIGVNMKRVIM